MSACISSHGEYDAHETDPDTYVCKWCHEFDETGAMAEIARLRRGPVAGMEHAIEQAAQVLDAVDRNHDLDSGDLASSEEYARALAAEGLVDRAEGESWYDAEPDAMPDAGWEPIEPVDRAEGDGRADCGCAYCHAIHHANPYNGKADESGGKAASHE